MHYVYIYLIVGVLIAAAFAAVGPPPHQKWTWPKLFVTYMFFVLCWPVVLVMMFMPKKKEN